MKEKIVVSTGLRDFRFFDGIAGLDILCQGPHTNDEYIKSDFLLKQKLVCFILAHPEKSLKNKRRMAEGITEKVKKTKKKKKRK